MATLLRFTGAEFRGAMATPYGPLEPGSVVEIEDEAQAARWLKSGNFEEADDIETGTVVKSRQGDYTFGESPQTVASLDKDELLKFSKDDLMAMADLAGVSSEGTKADIADRLLESQAPKEDEQPADPPAPPQSPMGFAVLDANPQDPNDAGDGGKENS
jgi:hypothetical protein